LISLIQINENPTLLHKKNCPLQPSKHLSLLPDKPLIYDYYAITSEVNSTRIRNQRPEHPSRLWNVALTVCQAVVGVSRWVLRNKDDLCI